MQKLEVFLVNLFMMGETCSTSKLLDTTVIQCDGFIFEFKQHDIKLKQNDFLNKTIITTTVTIQNIIDAQVLQVLEIIDDLCWLLSFAQQSPVRRHGHKIGSTGQWSNCSGILINPLSSIIEMRSDEIRKFIEQVYPTFKELKLPRQLTVVFEYLCAANRSSLALEISLISHYVAIENLKNTFALNNQYEYSGQYFTHKDFPHLENPPPASDIENYWQPKGKRKKYVHKIFGQVSLTEITKRMFEATNFNREEITPFLTKRHTMIHEGILLPFGDPNYMEQAIEDRRNVSDLLRKYLLTLLNYKGSYYLSRDRIGPSGLID